MLYEVKSNILFKDWDVFCQQVNCKGVMGAGLAKQISALYPEVYEKYMTEAQMCTNYLGDILIVKTHDDRICVNMYAQDGYGRDRRYTDYNAFKSCLEHLKRFLSESPRDWKVAFPYGIGCGLAGGDWYLVKGMLLEFSRKVPQDVYIVALR